MLIYYYLKCVSFLLESIYQLSNSEDICKLFIIFVLEVKKKVKQLRNLLFLYNGKVCYPIEIKYVPWVSCYTSSSNCLNFYRRIKSSNKS